MRGLVICWALTILLSSALLPSEATAQMPAGDGPLTNAAIVKLVKARFKEKTIITIIESRNSNFDLSTERMIELKRSGVSERIILAMLAHQQGLDIASLWDDEAFFNSGIGKKDPVTGQPSADSGTSTDIFGSSGGSRGGTKSRGGNSSSSGDTLTTGSATVRIIRPPSEAGAPVKLEKVATLTNNSVAELVDAGFSEGTIIRRIEQSPVEFDLSPAKVAELRKRRVSEKVLSAMKAAAGEDEEKLPRSNGRPAQ